MPGLVQLNDDYRNRYGFGDSPKERILAALRLIDLFEVLEAYHRSKGASDTAQVSEAYRLALA